MQAIYQPKGKAGEYGKYAINLYRGCSHGCEYCYAPNATYTSRDKFKNVSPRDGILASIKNDIKTHPVDKPVFLCFTCDPYQPMDIETRLTRQTILLLHSAGIPVTILTKGGSRAERDFDLLTSADSFGVTLTCLTDDASLQWEPGAAIPSERISSMRKAHSIGVKTWVSLEPVIDPVQTLELIRLTADFTDLYKVGKMNYHPISKTIDWTKFAESAISLLESLEKQYYIKEDLKKFVREKATR
jgi:DNA repair photolyase